RPARRAAAAAAADGLRVRPLAWLLRHAEVLLSSLGRLWRSPLPSLMTVAVIGIALALPAGLHLLLENARALAGGWDGSAQVSLFLRRELASADAERLAATLRARPGLEQVTLLPRAEALEEFRRLSGFGAALDALADNPLPDVIVLRPAASHAEPAAVERLVGELGTLPGVERAQLDMQWVKRLHALMEIVRRGVLVIAVLLGLAVLLIVGNTIRLDIQNRRREIEVAKLIGATDAFIRRPFLYSGAWYGLLGGVAAWLLVSAALWATAGPVERLAVLYQSGFTLVAADAGSVLLLLLGGALLGLLGSWLAVGRHLREIEPS
ncbi:MAG TPA: permease-like cell division protein FtsX, partial [Gammaproteobacteria bacterium]